MNPNDATICHDETSTCREELRLRTLEHHSTSRKLEQHFRQQTLLNTILLIALEPLPLRQQLQRVFSVMFAEGWSTLEKRGAIYGLKLPEKRDWVLECVHGMPENAFPDVMMNEPVAKPRHRVSGEAPGEKKAQHIQHM